VSKYLKIVVTTLAAVALAAPAFATSSVSGYYRMQMITQTINGAPAKNKPAESVVDNRLRMAYKNQLNDYLYFVYYAEVDTPWGQLSKGSIGGGGEAGADGVNVETKNAYIDFKIPNSIFSFRSGVQGYADRFNGAFVFDDMAGIQANLSIAPAFSTNLAYFKFYENNKALWDDVNLYGLQNTIKVNDNLKIDADLYWRDNASGIVIAPGAALDTAGAVVNKADDLYVAGVAAQAKVAGVGLDGWVAYQFGKQDRIVGSDVKYGSLGASAKASMDAGPAKVGLRLTYFSKDDSATDDKAWQQVATGNFDFTGENLSIFYCDVYYNNTGGGRHAMTDAASAGYGLFAVNATADVKLPANLYLKSGAGYFMALDDTINKNIATKKDGKDLGIEVAARVGTKIAEKVDVSLGGAYAFVGNFYNSTTGGSDPDNMYKVNFMINMGY
jgi:hypothetical protein